MSTTSQTPRWDTGGDIAAWIASIWAQPVRRECWWVHDPMGPADAGATCDDLTLAAPPVSPRTPREP